MADNTTRLRSHEGYREAKAIDVKLIQEAQANG